ncbi:hypothetical protein SAMN05216226_12025 [Halovenus aranensis]|uniref:Uncharacterized protein n=1 Tax=Halovenus aranensis TaxID=890420 RepID=A0A1G8ZEB4_9EURY|nr:hypothetical protein SAMN05216226_12025 [Halovenus aranensis]
MFLYFSKNSSARLFSGICFASTPAVNYLGWHNLYQYSLTKIEFMKGVLFINEVAVIGYRDPRPD